ncbi:hypothetical protein [Haloferula sp. A504]|uniref:hypothetical protein n=1 Tax=Haloferula sp. A504 TaxID=3373601 RepID=UPI0031CB122F|nr:hypothetical protein [Verrucomicrobiaceae bacterium E54]
MRKTRPPVSYEWVVKRLSIGSAIVALSISGCVHQRVAESVAEATVAEGRRYAEEVEAQSPFETVEIRWSEAETLMEERNPAFVDARRTRDKALEEKPLVGEITEEVKDAVTLSFDDIFDTSSLLKSLSAPATQLPKQFASISKLKDLSHGIQQSAWEDAAKSVNAEMVMRREKVRLHRLLRTGELIDQELRQTGEAPASPGTDPELGAAIDDWQNQLQQKREAWIEQVRELFDAEYHDVRFIRDRSALPTYRKSGNPDLTEWQRWCRLCRSHEVVSALGKAHESSKPAVPGTELVTGTLGEMFLGESKEPESVRSIGSVRKEVRSLIQNWREMKEAQQEAARLEKAARKRDRLDLAALDTRRKLFQCRLEEIEHASVVWMMDENCWQ